MHRMLASVTIALVALVGLTACTAGPDESPATQAATGGPGDGGQSVADACALVQDTIATAVGEFDSASADDGSAIVDSMKAAADRIADAAGRITNDEIAALLPGLEEMFRTSGEVWQSVVDGDLTKLGDLATLGQSMQGSLEEFQRLCAA